MFITRALPGFGQPFGQRGGPGRHGSASVGQSACLNTSPQFTTPPILTATLGNTGEIRQSSISPPVLFLPSGRALQVAPERPSTCLISPGHVAGHVGRKKGGLHNPDLAWPPRKLYGHGQRFRASLRPAPVISPKKVADRSYGPCNEHSQCVSAPRSRARTRLRQRRPRGII